MRDAGTVDMDKARVMVVGSPLVTDTVMVKCVMGKIAAIVIDAFRTVMRMTGCCKDSQQAKHQKS